jgi:pimeloyl-ACP methyl ester carboxylesterase
MEQELRFCTTRDGVRIAYAKVGSGPPFVKAANWLNHLEFDWKSPIWSHFLHEFAADQTVIRYDERGTGLSDWNVDELSFDSLVDDLEAVVDSVGVERFPLLGISQGGPVAIAYAIRNPERVSHLILQGSYARGWNRRHSSPEVIEQRMAELTLVRLGWGQENPAFRQMWTSQFFPNGGDDESRWFNELQRVSTSPEMAERILTLLGDIDVLDLLPKLDMPVLVVHCRKDLVVPFEEGRRLASLIPNARLLVLESANHVLLENEPAWQVFVDEVRQFIERPTTPRLLRRKCPKCGKIYETAMNFCLEDGSALAETDDPGSQTGDDGPTRIL